MESEEDLVDASNPLEERLARIEACQEILSLPARYARAADARDLDALVELFVPDVQAGGGRSGRAALREDFAVVLAGFYRSVHFVCGQVIDELGPDHARGTTYCRAEQEITDRWIISAMRYEETFELRDGRWYFARRLPRLWYSADARSRPNDVGFDDWPEMASFAPTLPAKMPRWAEFWSSTATPPTTHPVPPPG